MCTKEENERGVKDPFLTSKAASPQGKRCCIFEIVFGKRFATTSTKNLIKTTEKTARLTKRSVTAESPQAY